MYGLSERVYLMPYFSQKNATQNSPILVFRRGETSLYKSFIDWYDYEWERSAPKRAQVSDFVTPATPSGAAIFAVWEGKHVFGIPKRDLSSGYEARFYGLGGKRENRDENFVDCAFREGSEETDGAIESIVSSQGTDYFNNDGSISSITIVGEKKIPRLILEKRQHTGTGSMKKEDDYYILVAYDAILKKRPKPTRELGAILLLTDEALRHFANRSVITISELTDIGCEIETQHGISIRPEMVLTPHGTASYLVRTTK
jgi:hypothetical protein